MSTTLFELSFFTYVLAFSGYVVNLISAKRIWKILGPAALAVGLAVQTSALVLRWIVTGQTELAAVEASTGEELHGLSWALTAFGRPPYTNFYESLIFLSWLVMLIYFVCERRWKFTSVGCVIIGIGLLLLGRALLASNPAIQPLEPALQSYWILLHVWTLFVAYACFLVACGLGLAFLLKVQTPSSQIGVFLGALAAPVIFLAAGASSILSRFAFQMCPVGHNAEGRLAPLRYLPEGKDTAVRLFIDVPYVGPILVAAALLFLLAAALYFRQVRRQEDFGARGPAFGVTLTATAVLALALLAIVVEAVANQTLVVPTVSGELQKDLIGPYRLAFQSNPDAIGLLILTLVASVGFLLITRHQDRMQLGLPDAMRLDEMIYRMIAIGFLFLSIGMVVGAVWAHASWGRYWGWDPKETWALITWLVYAIYLHSRSALGWTGKPGAFIAVGGFAVVMFCYLGVNLGLTAEGLHGYGAG